MSSGMPLVEDHNCGLGALHVCVDGEVWPTDCEQNHDCLVHVRPCTCSCHDEDPEP